MIKFKLSHGASLPKRNNPSDSGLDLEARGIKVFNMQSHELPECHDFWFDESDIDRYTLHPNKRILVRTGLQMQMPAWSELFNYIFDLPLTIEAQVRARSGLAIKNGITLVNGIGTIDNSYTGDIGAILLNTSNEPFIIKAGDRIAQLVFAYVIMPHSITAVTDNLHITNRNDNGLGSSGK